MSLPYNNIRSMPRLKDLLDQVKRDIFLTLNCHAVATVQTVDFVNSTLTATMNYCKTLTNAQGVQSTQNYNVLADMPVVALCGGAVSLSFPIKQGDQCLVLFNDRDLDNWAEGATSGEVNTPRLHSFSDGIALVGLNDISGWDTVRALLTNGNVAIGINPSSNKARIANTANGTLGTALSSLLTSLTTFFTAAGVATTAAQIATAAAAVNLSTVSTEISGLLE